MKILVVSSYLPPHLGGLEIVAEQQIKHLAKSGNEVQALTSHCGARAGVSRNKHGATIHRVKAFNFLEEKFGAAFPIFAPSIIWRAFKLVRWADTVHVHDAFYLSSFVAAFWAWVLRKPLVVTQHVALIPHPNRIVNIGQHVVYNTTGRFILGTSAKVFVLNSRVRQFLIDHHIRETKIVHLPNGVDTTLFYPPAIDEKQAMRKKYNLPAETSIALFVGRFVPKKGFHKLLQIKSEHYKIAFAGGTAPRGYAQDEHFIFLGSLSPAQLAEIYRACDVFILPSEGEGFPLTIQEAMASGLPIITTNDPGYDIYDFDTNYIHLIDPSVAEIGKTLESVTGNEQHRQKMSRYSRAYAEKSFSWDKNVSSILRTYSEVRS